MADWWDDLVDSASNLLFGDDEPEPEQPNIPTPSGSLSDDPAFGAPVNRPSIPTPSGSISDDPAFGAPVVQPNIPTPSGSISDDPAFGAPVVEDLSERDLSDFSAIQRGVNDPSFGAPTQTDQKEFGAITRALNDPSFGQDEFYGLSPELSFGLPDPPRVVDDPSVRDPFSVYGRQPSTTESLASTFGGIADQVDFRPVPDQSLSYEDQLEQIDSESTGPVNQFLNRFTNNAVQVSNDVFGTQFGVSGQDGRPELIPTQDVNLPLLGDVQSTESFKDYEEYLSDLSSDDDTRGQGFEPPDVIGRVRDAAAAANQSIEQRAEDNEDQSLGRLYLEGLANAGDVGKAAVVGTLGIVGELWGSTEGLPVIGATIDKIGDTGLAVMGGVGAAADSVTKTRIGEQAPIARRITDTFTEEYWDLGMQLLTEDFAKKGQYNDIAGAIEFYSPLINFSTDQEQFVIDKARREGVDDDVIQRALNLASRYSWTSSNEATAAEAIIFKDRDVRALRESAKQAYTVAGAMQKSGDLDLSQEWYALSATLNYQADKISAMNDSEIAAQDFRFWREVVGGSLVDPFTVWGGFAEVAGLGPLQSRIRKNARAFSKQPLDKLVSNATKGREQLVKQGLRASDRTRAGRMVRAFTIAHTAAAQGEQARAGLRDAGVFLRGVSNWEDMDRFVSLLLDDDVKALIGPLEGFTSPKLLTERGILDESGVRKVQFGDAAVLSPDVQKLRDGIKNVEGEVVEWLGRQSGVMNLPAIIDQLGEFAYKGVLVRENVLKADIPIGTRKVTVTDAEGSPKLVYKDEAGTVLRETPVPNTEISRLESRAAREQRIANGFRDRQRELDWFERVASGERTLFSRFAMNLVPRSLIRHIAQNTTTHIADSFGTYRFVPREEAYAFSARMSGTEFPTPQLADEIRNDASSQAERIFGVPFNDKTEKWLSKWLPHTEWLKAQRTGVAEINAGQVFGDNFGLDVGEGKYKLSMFTRIAEYHMDRYAHRVVDTAMELFESMDLTPKQLSAIRGDVFEAAARGGPEELSNLINRIANNNYDYSLNSYGHVTGFLSRNSQRAIRGIIDAIRPSTAARTPRTQSIPGGTSGTGRGTQLEGAAGEISQVISDQNRWAHRNINEVGLSPSRFVNQAMEISDDIAHIHSDLRRAAQEAGIPEVEYEPILRETSGGVFQALENSKLAIQSVLREVQTADPMLLLYRGWRDTDELVASRNAKQQAARDEWERVRYESKSDPVAMKQASETYWSTMVEIYAQHVEEINAYTYRFAQDIREGVSDISVPAWDELDRAMTMEYGRDVNTAYDAGGEAIDKGRGRIRSARAAAWSVAMRVADGVPDIVGHAYDILISVDVDIETLGARAKGKADAATRRQQGAERTGPAAAQDAQVMRNDIWQEYYALSVDRVKASIDEIITLAENYEAGPSTNIYDRPHTEIDTAGVRQKAIKAIEDTPPGDFVSLRSEREIEAVRGDLSFYLNGSSSELRASHPYDILDVNLAAVDVIIPSNPTYDWQHIFRSSSLTNTLEGEFGVLGFSYRESSDMISEIIGWAENRSSISDKAMDALSRIDLSRLTFDGIDLADNDNLVARQKKIAEGVSLLDGVAEKQAALEVARSDFEASRAAHEDAFNLDDGDELSTSIYRQSRNNEASRYTHNGPNYVNVPRRNILHANQIRDRMVADLDNLAATGTPDPRLPAASVSPANGASTTASTRRAQQRADAAAAQQQQARAGQQIAPSSTSPQAVASGATIGRFTPAQQRQIKNFYGSRVAPELDNLIAAAFKSGDDAASFSTVDFSRGGRFLDNIIGMFTPYHTWRSREFKNMGERMVRQPGYMSKMFNYYSALEQHHENENTPNRYKRRVPGWTDQSSTVHYIPDPVGITTFTRVADDHYNEWENQDGIQRYMSVADLLGYPPYQHLVELESIRQGEFDPRGVAGRLVPGLDLAGSLSNWALGWEIPGVMPHYANDYYPSRQAVINAGNGIITASVAEQVVIAAQRRDNDLPALPEHVRDGVIALLDKYEKQTNWEQVKQRWTSALAGYNSTPFTQGERDVRTAREFYFNSGYNFGENQYGSRAASVFMRYDNDGNDLLDQSIPDELAARGIPNEVLAQSQNALIRDPQSPAFQGLGAQFAVGRGFGGNQDEEDIIPSGINREAADLEYAVNESLYDAASRAGTQLIQAGGETYEGDPESTEYYASGLNAAIEQAIEDEFIGVAEAHAWREEEADESSLADFVDYVKESAIKQRYPSRRKPDGDGGTIDTRLSPRETAQKAFNNLAKDAGGLKPTYPEGGSDEELQAYYAEKESFEVNRILAIRKMAQQVVDRVNRGYTDYSDELVQEISYVTPSDRILAGMLGGRYGYDILQTYEDRFRNEIESDYFERQKILRAGQSEFFDAGDARIRDTLGADALALWESYGSLPKGSAEKTKFKKQNATILHSSYLVYRPELEAQIRSELGDDIFALAATYPSRGEDWSDDKWWREYSIWIGANSKEDAERVKAFKKIDTHLYQNPDLIPSLSPVIPSQGSDAAEQLLRAGGQQVGGVSGDVSTPIQEVPATDADTQAIIDEVLSSPRSGENIAETAQRQQEINESDTESAASTLYDVPGPPSTEDSNQELRSASIADLVEAAVSGELKNKSYNTSYDVDSGDEDEGDGRNAVASDEDREKYGEKYDRIQDHWDKYKALKDGTGEKTKYLENNPEFAAAWAAVNADKFGKTEQELLDGVAESKKFRPHWDAYNKLDNAGKAKYLQDNAEFAEFYVRDRTEAGVDDPYWWQNYKTSGSSKSSGSGSDEFQSDWDAYGKLDNAGKAKYLQDNPEFAAHYVKDRQEAGADNPYWWQNYGSSSSGSSSSGSSSSSSKFSGDWDKYNSLSSTAEKAKYLRDNPEFAKAYVTLQSSRGASNPYWWQNYTGSSSRSSSGGYSRSSGGSSGSGGFYGGGGSGGSSQRSTIPRIRPRNRVSFTQWSNIPWPEWKGRGQR